MILNWVGVWSKFFVCKLGMWFLLHSAPSPTRIWFIHLWSGRHAFWVWPYTWMTWKLCLRNPSITRFLSMLPLLIPTLSQPIWNSSIPCYDTRESLNNARAVTLNKLTYPTYVGDLKAQRLHSFATNYPDLLPVRAWYKEHHNFFQLTIQ